MQKHSNLFQEKTEKRESGQILNTRAFSLEDTMFI